MSLKTSHGNLDNSIQDDYSEPHKKSSCRQKFTAEEDQRLEQLVSEFGTHAWKKVSARMKTRSTRQCRERYNNYLAPNVTNGPWTPSEDALLEQKVKEMGQKWSTIASFFPGRSDVNIKNRYALLVSKGLAAPGVSFHKGFKAKRRAMEQKNQSQAIQRNIEQNMPQTSSLVEPIKFDGSNQVLPNASDPAILYAANEFLTKWLAGQEQIQQKPPTERQDWNKVNFDFETEWLLNQQISDPNSIFCSLQ